MANTGYDLNRDSYKLRYFWPDVNPAKLLKDVRRFVKDEGVEVNSIEINNRWDDEVEAITFEATVTYSGGLL